MAEIKIGCGPFLPSRQKYMEQFGCVEVSDAWFDPIPPKTLAKWQAKTPKGFDYLHVAWGWLGRDPLDAKEAPPFKFPKNDFGLMQPTDANRTVWQHVDAQARALGATTVLLKTPPTFAPSENNRANMATFVREIIGEVPYGIAWEPRGFWEVEETAALAKELDIVVVRDVYGEFEMPEPPTEGDAYYALTAPWGRTFFSKEDLFDLYDFLDAHPAKVWTVFRGNDRERNATALAAVIAEERGES
ncbi:MAG: hypothetical protein ACI81R_003234 [Bradymonadia bacterium]|jgi:uncharacterized protein YecE (DUF72 family)